MSGPAPLPSGCIQTYVNLEEIGHNVIQFREKLGEIYKGKHKGKAPWPWFFGGHVVIFSSQNLRRPGY